MATLLDLTQHFFDMFEPERTEAEAGRDVANDKACFTKAIEGFLRSGKKEDAFVVYLCFCEMFNLFGSGYVNTKKLLELLSDHEYHSGELLEKHRDHYSHSVYVFALGLAIYALDKTYRDTFNNFYGYGSGKSAGLKFLKSWGIVALFHDIGYPFQLAHEQIKTYANEVWGENEENPYVSFGNMEKLVAISKSQRQKLENLYGYAPIDDINDLLAYGIQFRIGYDPKIVAPYLMTRVVKQTKFMDHGYFSAVLLARRFLDNGVEKFGIEHLDILTAILLHNNFNKFDKKDDPKLNIRPIALGEHPLSYLLILCDELQCWDRMPYGKESKRDPIAWDIDLSIRDNSISAKYIYESYIIHKEKALLNKFVDEMQSGVFVRKILGGEKELGYISSTLDLEVKCDEKPKEKRINNFASDDRFINLYDLAKLVHSSYNEHCKSYNEDQLNEDFGNLPLEFKVSNIEVAKSYSYKLELINCFYSSKSLDYPVVTDFSKLHIDGIDDVRGFLCREEHIRWVKEKLSLGWKYGTDYKNVEERNKKKIHKSIAPFDVLPPSEQSKDNLMIQNMIDLLPKFESNIKIYNYGSGRKDKETYEIAGTGHRYFITDRQLLKNKIKAFLEKFTDRYRVVVRTCFAYGADQLIAECAVEMGLTIKATLPMPYEDYIKDVRNDAISNGRDFSEEDELKMRHLLAQCAVCDIIPDTQFRYAKANAHMLDKCDMLLALWDGKPMDLKDQNKKPINQGGTFDCIQMAKDPKIGRHIEVHIIDCFR